MTAPQSPEEVASVITGRYGELVVPDVGVRLRVAITATCMRDSHEVGLGAIGSDVIPGLATIECTLSGRPEITAVAADRRQRAREAAYDESADGIPGPTVHVEAAIETATRVRITPETVLAFERDGTGGYGDIIDTRAGLAAALRELGFEVEG